MAFLWTVLFALIVRNAHAQRSRRNVAVEIEFAPVVTVPHPRLGQALQYDVDLECHVVANPMPSITWFKDGFFLSDNKHYSVSHFANDKFTDTTLRVITIEKRQYGQYTCRAANKLGTSEGIVELFEPIIPVSPPACEQTDFDGTTTDASSTEENVI